MRSSVSTSLFQNIFFLSFPQLKIDHDDAKVDVSTETTKEKGSESFRKHSHKHNIVVVLLLSLFS